MISDKWVSGLLSRVTPKANIPETEVTGFESNSGLEGYSTILYPLYM